MNDGSKELNVGDLTTDEYQARMTDAIDNASDQDTITWLTWDGKRIAAIVPVEVAEQYERMIAEVLRTPVGAGDILVIDTLRSFPANSTCALCSHARRAHTTDGTVPEPRPEVDCQMCQDGKCRTPAASHQHSLETAARAGLLSHRRR